MSEILIFRNRFLSYCWSCLASFKSLPGYIPFLKMFPTIRDFKSVFLQAIFFFAIWGSKFLFLMIELHEKNITVLSLVKTRFFVGSLIRKNSSSTIIASCIVYLPVPFIRENAIGSFLQYSSFLIVNISDGMMAFDVEVELSISFHSCSVWNHLAFPYLWWFVSLLLFLFVPMTAYLQEITLSTCGMHLLHVLPLFPGSSQMMCNHFMNTTVVCSMLCSDCFLSLLQMVLVMVVIPNVTR